MRKFSDDEDTQTDLLEQKPATAGAGTAGAGVNNTAELRTGLDQSKKKKIKYGIIGALILIAIILAIVLPLTLKKSGGGNGPPPPIPPGFNPYTAKTVQDQGSNVSLVLDAADGYNPELHMQALHSIIPKLKDGSPKLGVDSKAIPRGVNNNFG